MGEVQAQDCVRSESKLLKRRLPKFEGPRSYGAALDDDGLMRNAMETFHEDYQQTMQFREEASSAKATFEQEVDAVLTCIGAQNSLREVMYKTVDFCREEKPFTEVEAFMASADEVVYSHALQTPYSMIQMLKRACALKETLFDENGVQISDERIAELSEEELEDITESSTLTATQAGIAAIEMISPEKRIENLLSRVPHRRETFFAVIEFCLEPKKFPEIQEYFKENPDLVLDKVQSQHTLSPDYYVDKLEKAGGLVWKGAWVATPEGRRLLAQERA